MKTCSRRYGNSNIGYQCFCTYIKTYLGPWVSIIPKIWIHYLRTGEILLAYYLLTKKKINRSLYHFSETGQIVDLWHLRLGDQLACLISTTISGRLSTYNDHKSSETAAKMPKSVIYTNKKRKEKRKEKKEEKKSWQMVWTNQLLSAKDKLTEK